MAAKLSGGNIIANCPHCDGAKSSFEWRVEGRNLAHIDATFNGRHFRFQLLRCAGCGRAGIAEVRISNPANYPQAVNELVDFYPHEVIMLGLPEATPEGITNEFREAERCMQHQCFRAAAGLFRSVLDKTMRANGYKDDEALRNLKKQIDAAAKDGILTEARKRRAHDEVRVLGNDVLHDEWKAISEEDVELAHHYVQRIIEDFYDERAEVEKLLITAKRIPDPKAVKPPSPGMSS